MSGRIPPYGEHFRRESTSYDVTRRWASRRYVLKGAPQWDIASDPTSERWQVRLYKTPVSTVQSTMQLAMDLLLDGAADGYYATGGDIHATCRCVRPGTTEKKVMARAVRQA